MDLRPNLPARHPDRRRGPLRGRQLLAAVSRALVGDAAGRGATPFGLAPGSTSPEAVVGRAVGGGRTLELVCLGTTDPLLLEAVAPVAARFGAELVVRHVAAADDAVLRSVLRHGGVVLAGRLSAAAPGAFAHAPAG